MSEAIDRVKNLNKTSWPMSEAIGIVIVELLERIADALEKQNAGLGIKDMNQIVETIISQLKMEKFISGAITIERDLSKDEISAIGKKLIRKQATDLVEQADGRESEENFGLKITHYQNQSGEPVVHFQSLPQVLESLIDSCAERD